MKDFRKLIAVIVAVGVLAAAGAAFAATVKTPAEIVSGLTGKTVEDLYADRSTGKTFGTIASEAGKLDEFKAQMLEQKKAFLDQRVADGSLTQEQADQIYTNIKNNQATCDGTGNAGIGQKNGVGFGQGSGLGRGMNRGQGAGRGAGMRNGTGGGMGYGTCINR